MIAFSQEIRLKGSDEMKRVVLVIMSVSLSFLLLSGCYIYTKEPPPDPVIIISPEGPPPPPPPPPPSPPGAVGPPRY